jgi:hypothetical protein
VIASSAPEEVRVNTIHSRKRNRQAAQEALRREPRAASDVDALLDRWVAQLEQPQTALLAPAPRGTAPLAPAPRGTARPDAIGRSRADAPGRSRADAALDLDDRRAAATRDALARVTLEGSTARFADEEGGEMVLVRSGQRVVHRGTVGTRGPLGLSMTELQQEGLTESQARALEFVATWFGAPFDAISATVRGAPSIEWGFWPMRRGGIARA